MVIQTHNTHLAQVTVLITLVDSAVSSLHLNFEVTFLAAIISDLFPRLRVLFYLLPLPEVIVILIFLKFLKPGQLI